MFDVPSESERGDGAKQRDASAEPLSDASTATGPSSQAADAQAGSHAEISAGTAGSSGRTEAAAGSGGSATAADAGSGVAADGDGIAGMEAPVAGQLAAAGNEARAGAGGLTGGAGAGAAASGTGGSPQIPALGSLHTPGCPSVAAEPGAAFCYDFEQGHKGPAGGETYFLWDTPDMPAATELSTPEQPAGSGDHVLFASPRLSAMYPSATIGHDTLRFSRGLVEFDLWANSALLDVEQSVVFFRYVPDDRDFNHVTQLLVRSGQAFLQVEDGSREEYPLARAPSATSKTHVSVVLDRSSSCSAQVYFDGEPVAASDAVPCAADGDIGAVEYGLVVIEPPVDAVSALYDNIAFGQE